MGTFLAILIAVFLFYGEPDVWDLLHQKTMRALSNDTECTITKSQTSNNEGK